jgi:hypothetical protein
MNDSENIKALIPVVCPHCSKTLVVEFLINANLLSPEVAAKVMEDVVPQGGISPSPSKDADEDDGLPYEPEEKD